MRMSPFRSLSLSAALVRVHFAVTLLVLLLLPSLLVAEVEPPSGDGDAAEELEIRFSGLTRIIASHHEPNTYYFAANRIFKTRDFGATWEMISPDLTNHAKAPWVGECRCPMPSWARKVASDYPTMIFSFAESPVEAGVLWAGTNDGNIQLSRDACEVVTPPSASQLCYHLR